LRGHAYRKLATLASEEEIDRLIEEFADRFGPIPPSLHRLFLVNRARLLAAARDIDQVETRGEKVMMVRQGEFVKEGSRFPRFSSKMPDEKLEELVGIICAVPR
jgi:transcription-repair coupling factor (superfamily II helicase)